MRKREGLARRPKGKSIFATCVALANGRDWQERKRPFSNSPKIQKKKSLILDKIKIEQIRIRLRRLAIIVSSSTKGAHLYVFSNSRYFIKIGSYAMYEPILMINHNCYSLFLSPTILSFAAIVSPVTGA